MMCHYTYRTFLITMVAICTLFAEMGGQLRAVMINLDYSHDTYFSGNPTGKSALDAAAEDISAAITSSLSAITTDVFTGSNNSNLSNGPTTATFNWKALYNNPTNNASEEISVPTIAADQITVFVGVMNLTDDTLGMGGPAGAHFQLSGRGFGDEWVGAIADAEFQSNTAMQRGAGPLIASSSGNATLSGTTASWTLNIGPIYGRLTFDVDRDNNGTMDDAATLDNFWHFDHTTPVASGKSDLYTVALHEILHAIGIGTSTTWHNFVSGTTWTGTEVTALLGSGADLIASDEGHIANSTMSVRLSDHTAQEAVMDPDITLGKRKTLTLLDLAFLRDLGYQTVPEPATGTLVLLAMMILSMDNRRQPRHPWSG